MGLDATQMSPAKWAALSFGSFLRIRRRCLITLVKQFLRLQTLPGFKPCASARWHILRFVKYPPSLTPLRYRAHDRAAAGGRSAIGCNRPVAPAAFEVGLRVGCGLGSAARRT